MVHQGDPPVACVSNANASGPWSRVVGVQRLRILSSGLDAANGGRANHANFLYLSFLVASISLSVRILFLLSTEYLSSSFLLISRKNFCLCFVTLRQNS